MNLSDWTTLINVTIAPLILLLALNALVFWQRHIFLYCVAAPINLIVGLFLAIQDEIYTPSWAIGIGIVIIGVFCLFRVVMKLFNKEA